MLVGHLDRDQAGYLAEREDCSTALQQCISQHAENDINSIAALLGNDARRTMLPRPGRRVSKTFPIRSSKARNNQMASHPSFVHGLSFCTRSEAVPCHPPPMLVVLASLASSDTFRLAPTPGRRAAARKACCVEPLQTPPNSPARVPVSVAVGCVFTWASCDQRTMKW